MHWTSGWYGISTSNFQQYSWEDFLLTNENVLLGRLVWDDENFSKSARNIALVKKADGWWLEADVEQTNGAYERRALCLEERIECFEDGTIEYV